MSIDRYFHYSLLNGNLSFIKFSNLIKEKSDSNYWKYIEENVDKTLAFKGLLERVDCNESNDYKRIVCSYLYVASRAEKKYHVLLFDGIWALLVGDGAKGYNGDDMDIDLNNRIPSTIYKDFIYSMMSHLLDENSKNMSSLMYSERMNSSDEYSDSLKNYIKGVNLFFRLCAKNWFDIFVINIILINKPYQTDDTMDDWPFNQIGFPSDTIDNDFQSLAHSENTSAISCTDTIDRDFNLYYITSDISKTFQDWDSFESFINGRDETQSEGLKEFKDFYQKLKEANFEAIKYDF